MLESSPSSPLQPLHDDDDDTTTTTAAAAAGAGGGHDAVNINDGADDDDDDDGGYETEEELYAIVDIKNFEGAGFDMQQLGEWSITGVELPHDGDHDDQSVVVMMKLGESMLFRGQVDELVGTALCFEQTQQSVRDSSPSLQYSCNTSKVIRMERIYAKPKQNSRSNPMDLDQSSGGSEQRE